MTEASSTIAWEDCDEDRKALLRVAWGAGGEVDLSYKLHADQLDVYRLILSMRPEDVDRTDIAARVARRLFALDVSRRWGKSYLCCVMCLEMALRYPGTRIPYASAHQVDVDEVVEPLMDSLIADAPPSVRPTKRATRLHWRFPNGSRIRMAGLDKHPNAHRGRAMDFGVIDEAGFVRRLRYVIESVFRPQMQGRPHARMLLASTPPESPAHEWSTKYVPTARVLGTYAKRTIDDNPLLSDLEREEFVEAAGGRRATLCRREYFAEHIVEASRAVCPEWVDVKDECTGAWDHHAGKITAPVDIHDERALRPDFFDAYAATDQGHIDLWAWLFGYWDFLRQRLIIEDEVVMRRATTSVVAAAVHGTERRLEYRKTRRVGDMPQQTAADLINDHELVVSITAKDDARTAIANARRWVQERRVIIHPRCRYLLAQIELGIWKDSGKDYERGDATDPDDVMGHLDAWQALVYLIRNVNERKNPYPKHAGATLPTHFVPDDGPTDRQKAILSIAGRKRLR